MVRKIGKPGGKSPATTSATRSATRSRALGLMSALGRGGAGVKLLDPGADRRVRILPTGMDSLDVAIGAGGYPIGRLTIFHGPESCGKTTASLESCAEVQARDGVAIYVDCERKLDLAYSETLGVDVESLVLVYPDSIEKCFKQLSKILRILRGLPAKKAKKGRFDRADDDDDDDVDVPVDESAMAGLAGDDFPIMIVLDSFQSLAAQRTFDAAYDQEGFNPESFAWSRVLRKFIPEIDDMQAVLLGISQVRVDLASGGFGPKKEKVAVGKAPGHHATVIVKWTGRKKVGSLRKGVTGELHELLIAKNQIGNPYRTASLPIVFGKGVDKIASTMAAAQATGALRAAKGKGSYTLDLASGAGADVVIKGQAGLQDLADHDPAMFAALRAEIRSRMGRADMVPTAAPADDAESLDED